MRALSKRAAEPGLELIDVPEPHPGPREVKIKVLRTGLCGTDLHILKWDDWAANTLRPPVIPGHEFFGEIVEVGADVMSIEPGQFASGEGHVVCGTCRNCRAGRSHVCARTSSVGVNRDGAFAEYVVIPATNVWVQPADMDPSLGAVFDPLGNAVHTALTYPIAGEDILITGAGPIGLMAAAIARHVGARNIVMTDVSDERLELAPAVGVNTSINVGRRRIREAQAELGMTEGFDIGLEMSGSPQATQEMIDNMMHGGRIAMLGLPSQEYSINWSTVITSMLTIKGIYGRQMYETWYAMSAMLSTSSALRKAVTNVISDVVPASDWQRAFDIAAAGSRGKVVLDWER